jgi:hypothetical protein
LQRTALLAPAKGSTGFIAGAEKRSLLIGPFSYKFVLQKLEDVRRFAAVCVGRIRRERRTRATRHRRSRGFAGT